MHSEKSSENRVIAVFVPGLPDTPGWLQLSPKKQEALLQHTSRIQQYRQMQRLGEFGELLELTQVQQLLDGEEMQMGDYLSRLYPLYHQRTISRKQQAFAELAATIPSPILKRITSLGQDVLGRFERISTAALGDIRNALRAMPLLPVSTDSDAEKYLEQLDGKLLEERQNRRKISMGSPDQQQIEKMATNAMIHYIKEAKLKTSAEKRQFLQRVIGWTMQAQAVHGTLQCGRIAIPDSIQLGPGRPRKHTEAA